MISFGAVESGRTRKTTSTNVTRSDSGDPKMFLIIDRTLWLSYVEAVISLIGNGFITGNLLYVLRVPDGLLVNAHLGLTVMKYRNCMTYLVFFFLLFSSGALIYNNSHPRLHHPLPGPPVFTIYCSFFLPQRPPNIIFSVSKSVHTLI